MSDAGNARVPIGAVVIALVAVSAGLVGGFVLKDRCTTHVWDGFQYRNSCYNDIFALYHFRGLDREPVPYVNGDGELADAGEEAGDLEYPVGTGYFIGAVASRVSDARSFFRWSAFGLAIAGAAAAVFLSLAARDRRRILWYALAPALVLYAFHNWDLLAVLALAIALFAYARRADGVVGAALGIGAATKVFPGLLLPGLALARWRREGRFPWAMVALAAVTFLAWNLPIAAINFDGFWFPWAFQSTRFPNFETSWFFIFHHFGTPSAFWSETYPGLTSSVSAGIFAGGAALLLWADWRAGMRRPYATAFGVLLIFLLSAKVYSPQFALWLLPFFVLLRLRWFDFAIFAITDALVWAAISAFFLAAQYGVGDEAFRLTLVEAAVVARYAGLVWLLVRSRRVEENVALMNERSAPRVELPA